MGNFPELLDQARWACDKTARWLNTADDEWGGNGLAGLLRPSTGHTEPWLGSRRVATVRRHFAPRTTKTRAQSLAIRAICWAKSLVEDARDAGASHFAIRVAICAADFANPPPWFIQRDGFPKISACRGPMRSYRCGDAGFAAACGAYITALEKLLVPARAADATESVQLAQRSP